MQKQNSMKFLVLLLVVLIVDVPIISASRHKQGKATTRGAPAPTQAPAPAPTQGPNQDAAKLSYGGNQNSAPAQPSYAHNPPPPSYQPYGQSAGHPPPPYSPQQPGQPQQPVIINHVQQPQSSGGLGTAGGLAVGALAGAAGGYALSEALKGDDEKTTTTTSATTTVAGATTTAGSTTTVAGGSTSSSAASTVASSDTTPTIFVTTIASNETTTLTSNSTSNDTTTESSASRISIPVNEALVDANNATASNHTLVGSDGIAAKMSFSVAIFTLIFHIIA